MIGGPREGGLWAQSFGLSLFCHAAVIGYFIAPIIDMIRFAPSVPEPMAVTLSVMELSPEALDPTTDDPDPVEPETPPEPEEIAAIEPEPEPAPEPEPESIAPVAEMAPEPVAAVDAATLSPIRPEGEGAAGLAPVGATDVRPVAPVASAAIDAPEAIRSVVAAPEPVAAVQSVPEPAPAPVPAAQDPEVTQGPPGVVDEFILRIRGQLALPCLVATPRRDPAGEVSLEFMAANEGDILSFASDLLANVAAPPPVRNMLVDPRQCPALNFVREGARYPTFPLAIAVQSPDVASGGRLQGALQGAGGRYVTLIVVDDNGVVQDLGPYLAFSGDTVTFDVPMSRFGPARDTQQLLLALATPGRPTALDTHNGFLAAEFFAALRQSVDRNAPMAMIPFALR